MTPAILTLAKAMATAKTEHDVRVVAEAMEAVLRVEGDAKHEIENPISDGVKCELATENQIRTETETVWPAAAFALDGYGNLRLLNPRTATEAAQDGEVGGGMTPGSPQEGMAASGPLRVPSEVALCVDEVGQAWPRVARPRQDATRRDTPFGE